MINTILKIIAKYKKVNTNTIIYRLNNTFRDKEVDLFEVIYELFQDDIENYFNDEKNY